MVVAGIYHHHNGRHSSLLGEKNMHDLQFKATVM